MKSLLLRAVVLARRRKTLAESTRRSHLRRRDHALNAIMVLAPTNPHGRRLRKRYGKVRTHLFTFLQHPDTPPDNSGSERRRDASLDGKSDDPDGDHGEGHRHRQQNEVVSQFDFGVRKIVLVVAG
jgi:hypothetical protein